MVKKASYSEKDIQHFAGLEGIRHKAEMYIGPTDDSGIFTLLRECLDNAVDEFLAGRNDRVTSFFSPKKNEFWVVDNGEGIPVGKHAKSGKSTLELVLTETHAGGKFGGTAYEKGSVGSHGVGGKAVTALSLEYEIFTCRSNKWYGMSFAKGKITEGVAASSSPVLPNGKKPKQGTVIHYTPDPEIFGKHKLPLSDLLSWAEITCYMNPGFRAVLINMDTKETKEFYSKEGPIELVRQKATKLKAELEDIFTFSSPLVEIAVAFSDAEGSHLSGYTNGLHNGHGGSHVETLGQALKETIAEWSKAKDAFTPALLLEGAIGLVNIKIPSPKFSSQTKEYLADPRGENFYEDLVTALQKFWKSHKDLARTIIDRANQLKELQASVRASKQLIMKLKPKRGKTGLPTKLMSSIRCKPEDRELFIVEGESAAGNARFARDQQYQEVLPLKGKIVNLMKREGLESEEIINILKSIGYNPQEKDPLDSLRVGRILLMADADADGPLKGDTKVLLLDGTRPTIKELAERWEKDPKPFWVYARDSKKKLVPTQALMPRVTKKVTKLVRITLDNGHVLKCSLDHKWLVNKTSEDDRAIYYENNPYVAAKALRIGDSLNSQYFADTNADGNSVLSGRKAYKSLQLKNGSYFPVHRWVMKSLYPKEYAKYKSLNRGTQGGMIHIHHVDHSSLNNSPENLRFIRKERHYGIHGREWTDHFNGSEKHLQSLKKFFRSKRGKAHKELASKIMTRYNKSQEHRETVALMNSDETQTYLQVLGRTARFYLGLKALGVKVCKQNWHLYLGSAGGVPIWSAFSLDETKKHIKRKGLTLEDAYALTPNVKHTYPTQAYSKFLSVARMTLEKYGKISSRSYAKVRAERGVRGDPKWETMQSRLGVTSKELAASVRKELNHKVIKVEIVDVEETPVYCLTVPEYGNFMVDDGHGNGVCSANCHINTLLLTLFASLLPGIFSREMIYVVDAPEYVVETKKGVFFGSSLEDLRKQLGVSKLPSGVKHIKGWGEASRQELQTVGFSTETRKLIKISPPDKKQMAEFKRLMSEDPTYRKELLGV